MSTPLTGPPAALKEPFVLQNLSPAVLKYLQSVSTGQRPLSASQLAELAQPPFHNQFLEYMRSASSNASDPTPSIDLSYPISNYFINSSHNTYLTGNQLSSVSSTDAYKQVLLNCCRCVEIDVWDGEPKSKLAEAEHKSGDEKKHKFGSRFARNISSHGPFKHFHKEKSPSKSTTSEEGDPLSMPTPWTSASTALRAEPRVLHGYTLTKEVPFRDVCVAIRDAAFVNSDLPVIVSLEIHAGAEQQEVMVEIIKSVWKNHLIPAVDPEASGLPSPDSLRNKILVKVKHVDPKKAAAIAKDPTPSKHMAMSPAASSSSDSEADDAPAEIKKKETKSSIIPSLSALGVYTRAYHFKSLSAPEATLPTHVFSLNEKKLMEVHSSSGPTIFSHNKNYLMRVFPSGTRVRSDNLDPAPFWRKGVQIVALNWQRWDEGMMLNHGMFTGSQGYILKPEGYRSKDHSTPSPTITTTTQSEAMTYRTMTLSISLLAAQDIPLPLGDTKPENFHPYVKCELHVEEPAERTGAPIKGGGKVKDGEFKWTSRTMKGTGVDFGEERVEFKKILGVVEELSFIRFKIQDDELGKDDLAAWACIRLDRLRSGLRFVHLLDATGAKGPGALLVQIEKTLV